MKIGEIVILKLSEEQAAEIMWSRRNEQKWEPGAVFRLTSNVGTPVHLGDEFPMTVVRVFNAAMVNGQVHLDGTDTYWAQEVHLGDDPGQWHYRR